MCLVLPKVSSKRILYQSPEGVGDLKSKTDGRGFSDRSPQLTNGRCLKGKSGEVQVERREPLRPHPPLEAICHQTSLFMLKACWGCQDLEVKG
jgi:hypothetical protein